MILDSNNLIQIIPIITTIIYATSLLILNRIVPLPKPSRRSATYGLQLVCQLDGDSERLIKRDGSKVITEYV